MLPVLRMHAPNTPSGNPRRIGLVIDPIHATPRDAIDLGYVGFSAVRELYPNAVEGVGVNISASEYKRLLNAYGRGN